MSPEDKIASILDRTPFFITFKRRDAKILLTGMQNLLSGGVYSQDEKETFRLLLSELQEGLKVEESE